MPRDPAEKCCGVSTVSKATSLMAYFFMVVVVALVSSYVIFGEKINFLQGTGVVAIIAAIYLVNKAG